MCGGLGRGGLRRRGRADDNRRLDAIQFGEALIEVCFPFRLNAALFRPVPLRGAFTVFGVQLIHHVHTLDDLAEG